ncbi:MAG: hypothetical protein ABSE52_07555 [Candidatus Dormibacteria bacterium]|jgi:hypothetical protein
MQTRVVVAFLAAVGLVGGLSGSVRADGGGSTCNSSGCVTTTTGSTPGWDESGGATWTCIWAPITWQAAMSEVESHSVEVDPSLFQQNPQWYDVSCSMGSVQTGWELAWYAPNTVSAQAVAEQAQGQFYFPIPQPQTSPPAATVIVNLPTYLYLPSDESETFTATASIPGLTATVTAAPDHVVWTTGDGGAVTCPGIGVPYSAGDGTTPPADACTYKYATTSAGAPGGTYSVTATIYYHEYWSASDGEHGDFGIEAGPTATEQITVDQIASVITAG